MSKYLTQVAKRYSDCMEYRDVGHVKTIDNITNSNISGTFRTKFRKGKLFHFEFLAANSNEMISLHFEHGKARITSSKGLDDDFQDLNDAFSHLKWSTHGTLEYAPSLLLFDYLEGKKLTDLKNAIDVADKKNGVVKIAGNLTNERHYEIWCDVEKFDLLKCSMVFDGFERPNEALLKMKDQLISLGYSIPSPQQILCTTEVEYKDVSFV